MSVFNKIELSNFLDKSGGQEWDADFRHTRFDLMGRNTAIVLENGSGKTKITNATLGMLSRNRSLIKDMKSCFAPNKYHIYSHVRVEFVRPDAKNHLTSLFPEGDYVTGEKYVFGVCGYRDSTVNLKYYCYPGTLDDAPIVMIDEKGTVTGLALNEQFEAKIRAIPNANYAKLTVEDWLSFVYDHLAPHHLANQVAFQLAGSGDKSASLFKTITKRGERFDQSFFYQHIAPSLTMSEAQVEGTDQNGNGYLDETILENTFSVIRAARARQQKQQTLEKRENTLKFYKEVENHYLDIKRAQNDYNVAYRIIAQVIDSVKHIVEQNPIPGIPHFIVQDNTKLNNLLKHIVITPDSDTYFALRDKGLAKLVGQELKTVTQQARRSKTQIIKSDYVIDIVCDLDFSKRSGGHKSNYFTLNEALNFIDTCPTAFLFGSENTTTDREPFKNLINTAFGVFEKKCDTNPARKIIAAKKNKRDVIQQNKNKLKEKLRTLKSKRDDLEEAINTFRTDKRAYDDMYESGLFSDEELERLPSLKKDIADKSKSLHEQHIAAVDVTSNLRTANERYRAFSSEHPGEDPVPLIKAIEAEEARLIDLLTTNQKSLESASNRFKGADTDARNLTKEIPPLERDYEILEKVRPDYLVVKERFTDTEIIGLEEQVRSKIIDLNRNISLHNGRLEGVKEEYQSEIDFEKATEGQDPSRWLKDIEAEKIRLTQKQKILEEKHGELNEELRFLEQNKVAPGSLSSKTIKLIPSDLRYIPLHEFIKNEVTDKEHAKKYLALFSSMLFAPVIEQSNEIERLLKVYGESNSEVILPVFHESSLQEFLSQNVLSLTEVNGTVCHIFAGKQTDIVECILEPEKIAQRQKQVRKDIWACTEAIRLNDQDLTKVSTGNKLVALAEMAKVSNDKFNANKIQTIEDNIHKLEDELGGITSKFTNEFLEKISNAQSFIKDGGIKKFNELNDALAKLKSVLNDAETELNTAKDLQERLRETISQLTTEFKSFEQEYKLRKENLVRVQRFMQEDLARYTEAAKSIPLYNKRHSELERKREYRLDEAARYKETLKNQNTEGQEKKLAGMLGEIEATMSEQEKEKRLLQKLEALILTLDKDAREYDRRISKLSRIYQKALKGESQHIDSHSNKTNNSAVVSLAIDLHAAVADSFDRGKFFSLLEKVNETIEEDSFDVLMNKVILSKKDISKCKESFDTKCDKEIDLFISDSTLDAHEKELLVEVKRNPSKIVSCVANWQDSLDAEKSAFANAREHEKKLRNSIASTLASLTISAKINCQILKRILNKPSDQATYELTLKIATHDEITVAIDSIIEWVEAKHLSMIGDDEEPYDLIKEKNNPHIKDIREHINIRCYRAIFKEPSIKYRHPDIRGGQLTRFDIGDNFKRISEGEKTSLSLLWLITMAEHAQERKRQLEISTHGRRFRAAESPNVLIIDGLFSALSKVSLIKQAFKSIERTKGSFQIIGLIHNQLYAANNDFDIFPNLFVGKTFASKDDTGESNWVAFEKKQKKLIGQVGFAAFQATKSQGDAHVQ